MSASIKEFKERIKFNSEKLDEKVQHKETKSTDVIDLYERCFFEYGWRYEELMELPVPVFLEIIEALKRRKESEAKPYKKKRKM